MTPPVIPRATYRLQLHKDFTFKDATALVPYLAALGVSHLYSSPFLTARPGSNHGYDIVDHGRLNPEIGTAEEFDALAAALKAHDLGLVLDIVPNHMAVGANDNAWWRATLEGGPEAPESRYFDIDYASGRRNLRDKVLLPVLGKPYGGALGDGEIELRFDRESGTFDAWYFDNRFPVALEHYGELLKRAAFVLEAGAKRAVKSVAEIAQRPFAERGEIKRRLIDLAADPAVRDALERAARSVNGIAGDPESWTELHQLLEAQAYRLASWRVAADEINYRRFFNINDLAGLRIEIPELFEETHRLIFRLIAEGKLQGLRIDHIDGLFDPLEYLERLRRRVGPTLYIVVEKILATHETLPEDWPVAGTTGYDSLNVVNGLFVDPDGLDPLDRVYRRLTGRELSFDETVYLSKKRIMGVNLASETNVLANQLHRLSAGHWQTRDFTLNGMRAALEEVIACLPVYRTYVSSRGVSAQDTRYLDWAFAQARKRSLGDLSIYDFLRQALVGDLKQEFAAEEVVRLAQKLQQLSGPVMAKGFEDTALYRYFRLTSLNEVGGDPRRFGVSVAAFHHINQDRLKRRPNDMLASATHDTKRGEDTRARINLLSEIPKEWEAHCRLWMRINRSRRSEIDGSDAPDRNHEYLIYQTFFGAWPLGLAIDDVEGLARFAERVDAYLQKAAREGKEHSGWTNPNTDYEGAVSRFIKRCLEGGRGNPFLADFVPFQAAHARAGAYNGLAQTLLRLTMPGMPDIYQGGDLWDFSLVDPDNRRPVDYAFRSALLAEIDHADPESLAGRWQDGREKLFLIRKTLALRAAHPALFESGAYAPLSAAGEKAENICAFVRSNDDAAVAVAAPRLVTRLLGDEGRLEWGETSLELPPGRWRCAFTGTAVDAGAVPLSRLTAAFPMVLLSRDPV